MLYKTTLLASLTGAAAFGSSPTTCSKSYIVVGAGGGGAPMAYGLAMAGCDVTVLERGPDDDWQGTADAAFGGAKMEIWNWETSWAYQQYSPNDEISVRYWGEEMWPTGMTRECTFDCDRIPDLADGTAQDASTGSLNMWMTHVAMVGGNTMHNLGFWLRGDCDIYAAWGDEWSCEATEAAFDQVEAMYAQVMRQADITSAPMAGYDSSADNAIYAAFVAAGATEETGRGVADSGVELGVAWTEWTNSIYQLPFEGPNKELTTGSSRVSAGKVFIDPLRAMANFHLHTNTKAMKLTFDGTTCTGVHACTTSSTDANVCEGDLFALTADETMLALGAVTTAQLLLVSGVGPASDLEDLGISVVADLPVGAGYQNHIFNGAMYCGPDTTYPTAGQSYFPADGILKGVETAYPTTTANVWAQGTSSYSPGWADYSMSFITNIPGGLFASFFTNDDGLDTCSNGDLGSVMSPVFVIVGVQYAHSRGSVKIASDDMADYPVWQPGMLTNSNDAGILMEAFAKIRSILTPALGYAELFPGDDADMQAYSIYGTSGTFWHDSSTTPIGTVLGSDLKVMGIEGLRVCDSSMQTNLANIPPTAIIQTAGLMGATIALKDAM